MFSEVYQGCDFLDHTECEERPICDECNQHCSYQLDDGLDCGHELGNYILLSLQSDLMRGLFQTAATSLTVTILTPTAVSSTGSVRAEWGATSSVLLTSTGNLSSSGVTGMTEWSVAAGLLVTSVRRDVHDLSIPLSHQSASALTKE